MSSKIKKQFTDTLSKIALKGTKRYMEKTPFTIVSHDKSGISVNIYPKFKLGDSVRYTATPEVKVVAREVTALEYIEHTQEFRYWVTGIGHAVDEFDLMKARVSRNEQRKILRSKNAKTFWRKIQGD